MSKKRKLAILSGVAILVVAITALALYMAFGLGYRTYAGEWELEKFYISDEDGNYGKAILPRGEWSHYNKETDQYDVTKAERDTLTIDHQGNYIERDGFGKLSVKGKLKNFLGKVSSSGKCVTGNFQSKFEKSGDKLIEYTSIDYESAEDNVVMLDNGKTGKTKYIWRRR